MIKFLNENEGNYCVNKNLNKFYKQHPQYSNDLIDGMLALYDVPSNPQGCEPPEDLRMQIENPHAAQLTTNGWHAMHFCLAQLGGEDMLSYLEKAKEIYTSEDWKLLSKPIKHSFGIFHALALNADEEAAILACDELKSLDGVSQFAEGGYTGFTPAHLAVLNGSARLAEHLRTMSEIEPGKERMTAFPLSSRTLEQVLAGGVDWRSDARVKILENRAISHAVAESARLKETAALMKNHELGACNKFRAIIGEGKKRKLSDSGALAGTRKATSWLDGLLSLLELNLFTWTPFHMAVVKPDCTVAELDALLPEHAGLLLNKDSLGRSALFYACACGTLEVIRWCIRHFCEADTESLKECDVHHRTLLSALMLNAQAEIVTAILPELLESGVSMEADLFGFDAVFYALLMGHSQAACDIYQKKSDSLGAALQPKLDLWKNCKSCAKAFNDEILANHLKDNKPKDESWSQGVYGGLY